MDVEYHSFTKREDRSKFILQRFRPLLIRKVLDVGCDRAFLRSMLKNVDYTGVDIGGDPDIHLDLEKVQKLPFDDNNFDCVICTDVLEHINNLHRMFDELVRVSSKHIVISLPNCWVNARQPISRGYGSFSHYGLPTEPPQDRHKWFFSHTDIVNFMKVKGEKLNLKIKESFATEKKRPTIIRLMRKLRYPQQDRYLNRYAHTTWTVFEKQ